MNGRAGIAALLWLGASACYASHERAATPPDAGRVDAGHVDGGRVDAAPVEAGLVDAGTDSGPAPMWRDCAEIHDANPSLPSGAYRLYPSFAVGPLDAVCDMTTAGGGWTLATGFSADVVDFLLSHDGRQLVKCARDGDAYIESPPFTDSWSWSRPTRIQVSGDWIVNGVPAPCGDDPEYRDAPCGTWWGVGCSSGPGETNKLYPGVLDRPVAELCGDDRSAHTNGLLSICGTNNFRDYAVFVRRER